MKKNIKTKLLIGFIAMLGFTNSAKAQVNLNNPFSITNNLPCDIVVLYEISDCVGSNPSCGSGTFVISENSSINITTSSSGFSSCYLPSILLGDVFVGVWEVDYQDITSQWATVSGACFGSQGSGPIAFPIPGPAISNCGGSSFSMVWTSAGVTIW